MKYSEILPADSKRPEKKSKVMSHWAREASYQFGTVVEVLNIGELNSIFRKDHRKTA